MGAAKIDITPVSPVPLAGFASRVGVSSGVSHPLYARIFVFQQRNFLGINRTALVVSADLIWWGPERIKALREKISVRWGIDEKAIILHATHNHSGPQTSNRFALAIGQIDENYVKMLDRKLLAGIELAFKQIEPVYMEVGKGKCHIGINRRKQFNGQIIMAPNEDGLTDPEVNVFRFYTPEGKIKGVWIHYTCHPTTTADNLVSSEFPGVAVKAVENKLGEEVVVAYLQGCCGDISPALIEDDKFHSGTDQDVNKLGIKLANVTLKILRQSMHSLAPCKLDSQFMKVSLPLQSQPLSHISIELLLLNIAEGLTILAMNGEIVVEYGLFIKKYFDGNVLPVAYSNGMIGYVPTANQIAEGGYEPAESFVYFNLPAPLAPEAEKILIQAIKNFKPKDRNRP